MIYVYDTVYLDCAGLFKCFCIVQMDMHGLDASNVKRLLLICISF